MRRTTAASALLVLIVLFGLTPSSSRAGEPSEAVVLDVVGSGNRTLEPFTVTNGWELRWEFRGEFERSLFQVFVNKVSGSVPNLPVDGFTHHGPGSGRHRMEEGGTYYLKVVGMGGWHLTVVQRAGGGT
ncbi:hypothetical protein [Candidatus Nitrospira bockiana]